MGILIDRGTRILVQGLTGRQGNFQAERMQAYGAKIVAGVTPGKGGTQSLGVDVFDSVAEAVATEEVDATIIFVPAPFAADAMLEAASAKVPLIVCITEHVPVHDMIRVREYVKMQGCRLLGPNCPGLITPGESKIGIMPNHVFQPGGTGIVSRSGTLTYEVAFALTNSGIGQSTVVGIGGDPIKGLDFVDILELFNSDPETKNIVMIGEIGGTDEQRAAEYAREHVKKPLFGLVAGVTAPPGRRMGHAGAIVSGGAATSAAAKIDVLKECGFLVAVHPEQIAELLTA